MLVVLLCAAVPGFWTSATLHAQSASPAPNTSEKQSPTPDAGTGQTLQIPAQSEIRSQIFHLKRGAGFDVTGSSSDPQFSVDLYVYNSAKDLVGKDDPDATESSFRWQAAVEGDYYVLARNLSAGSGTIHVAVTAAKGAFGGFRGLTPTTETVTSNYAVIQIFYATDRDVVGSDSRGPTYGGDPDPNGDLHYGQLHVSIPRDHRLGELEGPSIWRLEFSEDPKKDVVLQSVVPQDQAEFMKGISGRLGHSQKKEILVFVHGFNTTFVDGARRTAQIAYDMAYDGPTVMYSWPSQGSMSPFAYNKDGRNAALTASHLEAFLKMLVAQSGAKTVDLIAHSMGNRPVTEALRDFGMENPSLKQKTTFNQVALMAPDVDAALFKQMAHEMEQSAHRITLYASSRDAALRVSNYYAGYQRAGEGVPHLIVVPGMDTVDASAVDTSLLGFYHDYFADNTTILSDLFHDFMGLPPSSRVGLHAVVTAAGKYWKFLPSP
ncbi:MAG: alpha/beta hydrolase [Acidobacteriota bacterium]